MMATQWGGPTRIAEVREMAHRRSTVGPYRGHVVRDRTAPAGYAVYVTLGRETVYSDDGFANIAVANENARLHVAAYNYVYGNCAGVGHWYR